MSSSIRSVIRRSAIAGSLAASAFAPFSVAAQEEAVLAGVVSDEGTGQLIASATVTLVGTERQARTDAHGAFALADVPVGPVSVRVQAPGYASVVENLEVAPGAVVILQVQLLSVYAILGVLVEAPGSDVGREQAKSAADLLATQVPSLYSNSGTLGKNDRAVLLRGVQSITRGSEPVLFLDGVRMNESLGAAMDILTNIPASDVKSIRVLRGPTAAFLEGSANGAIYVETRSGSDQRR